MHSIPSIPTVNKFWRAQLRTCQKSLRGIKHDNPPITVSPVLTTTFFGSSEQIQFNLTMNGTCKTDLKKTQAAYVKGCEELLCPGVDEYWDVERNKCLVRTSNSNEVCMRLYSCPDCSRGCACKGWFSPFKCCCG